MRYFILIIILYIYSPAIAQTFVVSGNIEVTEITKAQIERAFNTKDKSVYKFRRRGQKVRNILNCYQNTKTGKDRAFLLGGYESNQLSCIVIENKSYLIQERLPVGSIAYLMSDETTVDTLKMFGNGEVDNNGIYYASPDFDSDEYVWCRWYSLKNKKVKLLADLKDTSYEYIIPLWDDKMRFPCFFSDTCFFSDNRGLYYLTICDKNTYKVFKYYQIRIYGDTSL